MTALRKGVDIVVACPGRLEDLIGQGHCTLDDVQVTVLDEADHMADLGFLPSVRRLLGRTPKRSQRLLFSATLDKAIDTLVKQFLHDPVTHQADSAQSPIATMSHHVLHVDREHRVPILVDLASAPGRIIVFTRTKHGAKALARQLNKSGVPTVELHGNLGQGARTRNMEAFHSGKAEALVATDIAARGIHVDDVALVVHADPPVEHKAYLHRSGRTARAGNAGTVVTLMTSEQVRDVRDLTRAAGIKPTTTRINGSSHPVLVELAPGERTLSGSLETTTPSSSPRTRSGGGGGGRNRRGAGRGRGGSAQRLGGPEAVQPEVVRPEAVRPEVVRPAVGRQPLASVPAPAAAPTVPPPSADAADRRVGANRHRNHAESAQTGIEITPSRHVTTRRGPGGRGATATTARPAAGPGVRSRSRSRSRTTRSPGRCRRDG